MYLVITTVYEPVQITKEQLIEMALQARREGKRSEIISKEEAEKRGLFDKMQDLTKL